MSNLFFTDEYTDVLQEVIREVVNDPKTYRGSKYLPSRTVPVNKVRTEVIEASGGLTNEHMPGTDPEYVQRFGTRVQEYVPPKYKEAIHYDEDDILFLRELGNNGRNVRGVRQYINEDIDRLNRRLEARIEYMRWYSIFNGGFTWMGKTISFGFPAGNTVTPVGAVWSSDGVSANGSANPLVDLRYWCLGGKANLRKYKFSKLVMNPNTARWILDNSNVQSLVQHYFSSDIFGSYELNKTLQMLIPGLPEVDVYDGWYQTESTGGGVTTNQIVVSDAVYFVPDGYIFFEISSLPGGDKIGTFDQTVQLADGTVDNPGVGKFLVVDENIAPGTRGGPKNPYIDLVSGVYGGPNIKRGFDVVTAKVIS